MKHNEELKNLLSQYNLLPEVKRKVEEEFYIDKDFAIYLAKSCRTASECDDLYRKHYIPARSRESSLSFEHVLVK